MLADEQSLYTTLTAQIQALQGNSASADGVSYTQDLNRLLRERMQCARRIQRLTGVAANGIDPMFTNPVLIGVGRGGNQSGCNTDIPL